MNQSDKEAFIEIVRGLMSPLLIMSTFLVLVFAVGSGEPSPPEPTRVVDTFENCRIIQWTDPSGRYQYLADCSEK